MVMRAGRETANFVIRFVSDTTRYKPAPDIERQNRRIQHSQQLTAAQARVSAQQAAIGMAAAFGGARGRRQRMGAEPTTQQAWNLEQERARRFRETLRRTEERRQQQAATAAQQQGGNWFTRPGPYSGKRMGAITALPAGPSAIAGTAFGRTAGALTDIGVVGGLLPEGLGAGAAIGGLALAGGVLALSAFTRAVKNASRELGTFESLELRRATFELRREMILLGAELGQIVLPQISRMTRGMASVARWMRNFAQSMGWVDEVVSQGRSQVRLGFDPATGRPTGGFIPRRPASESAFFPHMAATSPNATESRIQRGRRPLMNPFEFAFGSSPYMPLPGYQHGGIVSPRPGGVLARVAEGSEAEAIVPMRHLARMMGMADDAPMRRSYQREEKVADDFQSALRHSQDLPPLWQMLERDTPRPVSVVGNVTANVDIPTRPPLTFISRTDWDDPMGMYNTPAKKAAAGRVAIYGTA